MNKLKGEVRNVIDEIEAPLIKVQEKLQHAKDEWKKTKNDLNEQIRKIKDNFSCDEDILDFLKFLSDFDYSEETYVFLPRRICNGDDYENVFDRIRDEQDLENPIIKLILDYEKYFETGSVKIIITAAGRIEGYKGDETYFDEIEDLDVSEDISYEFGICDPDFIEYFDSESSFGQSDGEVEWPDGWDSTWASIKVTKFVSYLKLKNEKNLIEKFGLKKQKF